MRPARSAVEVVWPSRDEPPTPGPARSRAGHGGSLDPDRALPPHRPACRRSPAAAGPGGTADLLPSSVSDW